MLDDGDPPTSKGCYPTFRLWDEPYISREFVATGIGLIDADVLEGLITQPYRGLVVLGALTQASVN